MARIVIIEDEPDLALGLRDNLEFEQHEVAHAATGEQGLELVRERPPTSSCWTSACPTSTGSRSAGGCAPRARPCRS
jgi:DNA-binding response OmpR family regulator